MGGDLNLKKSWHPHLRKNQERVWKEEKTALDERRQIEKLRKEREEERAVEELQKLAEASGGRVAQKRVDWMYSGPGSGEGQVTEEQEAYLLGKRRIDNLLKTNEASTQSLTKGAAASIDTLGGGNANSARDVQSKVLNDPLLAIQKQKLEMQMKVMKDAQKAAKNKEKKDREKDRGRRHRHSRRDRSRSRDSSDDRDRRHRHRHRSRSPRRRDRDDYRRRDRSYSRDLSDDRDRRHRHSRRDRSRSKELSDERDRRHRPRYQSRSPRREDRNGRRPRYQHQSRSPPRNDMAERLAKMQTDASSLEDQRNERVRLREAEDVAEEEKRRQNRDGGHRFISNMRSKATENMDLGDVMSRGRQGFRNEADA